MSLQNSTSVLPTKFCSRPRGRVGVALLLSTIFGWLALSNLSWSAKEENSPSRHFNVGYKVLDWPYLVAGKKTTMTVAVWYPTSAVPKTYRYGGPAQGHVAVNAAPYADGGPYPLLVFSHGYGGGGLAQIFLTETLAARGWIVAAPDHHDKDSAVRIRSGQKKNLNRLALLYHAKEISRSGPEDRDAYLYRVDELKFVLEQMLRSESFGNMIDRDKIAVGGHSFGGFTALGLCGTIAGRQDERIKAVLIFSSGASGYLFRESELAQVRIPTMYFLGEREKGQRRGAETMAALSEKVFKNMPIPKFFLEVKGASHFSFNNRFADNFATRRLSGSEEQFDVIRRYSIAFLEKYVAGRKDAAGVLDSSAPLLTRYLREP